MLRGAGGTGQGHGNHVLLGVLDALADGQLPYALTAGVVACIGFLIIGVTCA